MDRLERHKAGHRASLLGIIVLAALAPADAFAYIDPGSGSLLLQIVMSAFFGALFLARKSIARVAATTRRLFGNKPETPPARPDEPGA